MKIRSLWPHFPHFSPPCYQNMMKISSNIIKYHQFLTKNGRQNSSKYSQKSSLYLHFYTGFDHCLAIFRPQMTSLWRWERWLHDMLPPWNHQKMTTLWPQYHLTMWFFDSLIEVKISSERAENTPKFDSKMVILRGKFDEIWSEFEIKVVQNDPKNTIFTQYSHHIHTIFTSYWHHIDIIISSYLCHIYTPYWHHNIIIYEV